jgi:hypothetical protein
MCFGGALGESRKDMKQAQASSPPRTVISDYYASQTLLCVTIQSRRRGVRTFEYFHPIRLKLSD